MEKENWPLFLSSKIRAQISIESSQKNHNWALGILALGSLGFALSAMRGSLDGMSVALHPTKVLFLVLYHAFVIFAFFLPGFLQKGQRAVARLLQIKDFTSLIFISSTLLFYSFIVAMLSFQAAKGSPDYEASAFFAFAAWTNFVVTASYVAAFAFYLVSLIAFPTVLVRIIERGSKAGVILFILHAAVALLLLMAYSGLTPIGSPEFFEQFRVAGLFGVFLAASLLLTGRLLQESAVPALSALELDVVSGRLDRKEVIIPRLKEAFVPARFESWLKQFSKAIDEKSAEIAKYAKEAVDLIRIQKPSEIDLRQIEDRYRRAENLYKKLEKDHQRFMVSMVFFELAEVEKEKAALVRDLFSRELRNVKLELAGIRKLIDEKLVAIKEARFQLASAPAVPAVESVSTPTNN